MGMPLKPIAGMRAKFLFEAKLARAKKDFPSVAKRAEELKAALYGAKSPNDGLQAIQQLFDELGKGELQRYPVNAVETLYFRAFLACFDCLHAIEQDMQKRSIPTDPIRVMVYEANNAWTELTAVKEFKTQEEADKMIATLDKEKLS